MTMKNQEASNAKMIVEDFGVVLKDLEFDIRRYSSERINRGSVCYPINNIWRTMSNDEQYDLYDTLSDCKTVLTFSKSLDVDELTSLLSSRIYMFVHFHDYINKVLDHVRNKWSFPDLSDVGSRVDHLDSKTFFYDDYLNLTTMFLIVKTFTPILGELNSHLMRYKDLSKDDRDVYLFSILENMLLKGPLETIYDKFSNFINSFIDKAVVYHDKKSHNLTLEELLTSHNLKKSDLEDVIVSSVFVKNVVNFDILTSLPDGSAPNAIVYFSKVIPELVYGKISDLRKSTF